MVRFQNFLMARYWVGEYGSVDSTDPADPTNTKPGEAAFGWLIKYSPYQNIKQGVKYPAILFTAGENDTRVHALHARKMCAALQHATAGEGAILLRRESDVGHGDRAVSRRVDLSADQLAFAAHVTGL